MEGPSPLKGASREIFSGLARSYETALDVATVYQDRAWKEWVSRRLKVRPGDLVLDVGCGTLVLEGRLRRRNYRFVGVDLSIEMLRVGQGKRGGSAPLLVGGDAESLPLHAAAFDFVVSCYVPKYVDARRFARELARVTRPGAGALLYDFARPRGRSSPVLQMYIQGGLRLAGAGLRAARRGEAATFDKLPRIIGGTKWDEELPPAMEGEGFETLETARLTGGIVFAYWGRKRQTL